MLEWLFNRTQVSEVRVQKVLTELKPAVESRILSTIGSSADFRRTSYRHFQGASS